MRACSSMRREGSARSQCTMYRKRDRRDQRTEYGRAASRNLAKYRARLIHTDQKSRLSLERREKFKMKQRRGTSPFDLCLKKGGTRPVPQATFPKKGNPSGWGKGN